MQVAFEYATLHDLPQIVETYNSTVAGRMVTADLLPVSVTEKLNWFNSHNTKTRPLWKVMVDGEYAGWMSFSSFHSRPAYSGTVEVSIYMNEKFRAKGLGKICLEKAIAEAPAMGIHSLLGLIFGHNEPSLKLFQKCGFKTWAHLPGVANMDGTFRDLIILGRKV